MEVVKTAEAVRAMRTPGFAVYLKNEASETGAEHRVRARRRRRRLPPLLGRGPDRRFTHASAARSVRLCWHRKDKFCRKRFTTVQKQHTHTFRRPGQCSLTEVMSTGDMGALRLTACISCTQKMSGGLAVVAKQLLKSE